MAKKKIYKHHQRTSIAQAITDAQNRELVLGSDERQVGVKFGNGQGWNIAPWFDVKAFGALGDNSTDDYTAIQNAIDAATTAGKGTVYFPYGRYVVGTTLTLNDNIMLVGESKFSSVIVVASGVEVGVIVNAVTKSGWRISNLGFDNSANYPDADTTVPNEGVYTGDSFTFANNTAVFIEDGCNDWQIDGCRFLGISGHGIRAASSTVAGYDRFSITNNYFYNGSYAGKCISVAGKSDGTDKSKQGVIQGNVLYDSGVNKYLKLGISVQNASTDAIEVDQCEDVSITGNVINKCAGVGIRVEASNYVCVVGNVVREAGQEGIEVYKGCLDVVVANNVVKNWGRIPNFGSLRKYPNVASTNYYLPREMPDSSLAPFPADPSASSWWVLNPYNLQSVSDSTIPVYSTGNYYTSTAFTTATNGLIPNGATNQSNFTSSHDQGVLAFRGYAGISVDHTTEKVIVCGNRIVGNLTQTGGKYDYASDFGIKTVHSTNAPVAYASPAIIFNNLISGCIQSNIYQPSYVDPINARGAITGVRTYPGNYTFTGSNPTEIASTIPDAVDMESDLTVAGELKLTAGPALISPATADAADSKAVHVAGGGAASYSRGAYVALNGNEHATDPGKLKLVAGSITGGGDIEFWTNNALRLTIYRSGGSAAFASAVSVGDFLAVTGMLYRGRADGIVASTTQTQGQMALTKDINIVATVANANDVVTLPSCEAGFSVYIRNNGANTLQIFPASGDRINGAAANASATLAAGASVTYHTADSTNWYS